jgi:putative membrane protein
MNDPLTPAEHQRIDAAVAAVERGTSADLDVVVTRVSDRYSLYPLVWAGLAALIVTALAAIFSPRFDGRSAILVELLLVSVFMLLFELLPIRLALVPERVKRAHARDLAHREFAAHRPGGDPRRHRILLFVSLGEHYVEVVADHDTHAMAPAGAWDKLVADFVAAVKTNRLADGIVGAIEACGAILQEHHPAVPSGE